MSLGKVGIVFPGGDPAEVEALEQLGYDSVWSGEHILYHGPTLDALVVLAAFAARSERLKVGSSVVLLPLRPPALVAKAAATLDILSGGRLILGVGVGGEYPPEFEALGIPLAERGARADEALRILKLLWAGEPVSFEGRFYRLPGVRLDPPPAQAGGPPVWVGGRSRAARRRAARLGDGWFPYLIDPDQYREGRREIEALRARAGREGAFTWALLLFTRCDDDPAAARRIAVERLSRMYARPFNDLVDRYCAFGPPEACAERIRQFRAAGVEYFVLSPVAPPEELLPQAVRYATEVLPLLD
jgi:probable F420-dependent oxidoreductase